MADGELRLALGRPPRRPVYLFGQIGERAVSLHGERGRLVIQTPEGERREMALEDLGVEGKETRDVHQTTSPGAERRPSPPGPPPAQEDDLPGAPVDAGAGAGPLGPGDRGGPHASHRLAAAILEYWLGRVSKRELAERLALPPLRIWQMSRQALSGMLAGLLVQPRRRGGSPMPSDPNHDPKRLRARIAKLERELEVSRQLIDLLRQLPGNRRRELPRGGPTPSKTTRRSRTREAPKGGGKKRRTAAAAPPPGDAPGGGSLAAGEPPASG